MPISTVTLQLQMEIQKVNARVRTAKHIRSERLKGPIEGVLRGKVPASELKQRINDKDISNKNEKSFVKKMLRILGLYRIK